jgi:DNA-binding response OmpR family regulator
MRILLVEDNPRLNELMTVGLRDAGYVVDRAHTADQFEGAALVAHYDLYIVDLGLPDSDGLRLINELRKRSDKTPILVVTARDGIDERVRGLDCGADDYLVKPFNQIEFLARARALMRRSPDIAPSRLSVGQVQLDIVTWELSCAGQAFELPRSQRRLLAVLMRRAGHLVPREVIEEHLSGLDQETSPNAVEQHVSRLRKVLSNVPAAIQIRTVRGLGYVLEARE